MKPKILVCETLSSIKGGQSITLEVERLCRSEYDFVFMLPEKGELSDELDRRGIKYRFLGSCTMKSGVKGVSLIPRYAAMSVRAIFRICRAVLAEKVSLIYAPGPAAMPWAAIAGTLTNRGTAWHLHHIFEDRATSKLLTACAKLRSVKKIAAISPITRDQFPLPTEKCVIVPNPIDPDKFKNADRTKIRRELSIPDTATVLCQIGFISPVKRQDVTLDAAEELLRRGLDVFVIFCGDIGESSFADRILEKAEADPLAGRVSFMGKRRDIPDILAASDVCVVPSMEGFSMAALEAVCSNVPVVCPDNTGCTDIVISSGCGKVYSAPANAADAIFDAVTSSVRDSEARSAFIDSHSEARFKEAMCGIFADI